ncbi:MAG: DUF1294 domain-containing protein [Verrucomicrobium sp.]|nr:DUF1294 domain-containing protein [Verrucomicrobium sp.]
MSAPISKSSLSLRQYSLLALLLALPLVALALTLPRFWMALLYLSVMSLATYGLYGYDKQRAQTGRWRIPESRLHLFALMGGWPGAYLAQHRFRHKTSKPLFQAIFWITVVVYQCAALDGLLGWPLLGRLGS